MVRSLVRLALIASMMLITAAAPAATSATVLTPPPPADARCQANQNGTICFWTDTAFHTPGSVPYGVSCDGFSVRVQLSGVRRFTFIYDTAGTLVERIRHISFSGALSNSLSGSSVPHVGHFTVVDDFQAGTTTITGMLSRTVVEGDGLIWRNIGRVILSLSTGALLFEAGEHGTYDVGGDPSVKTELCAALS
jgi:hypothetical protein